MRVIYSHSSTAIYVRHIFPHSFVWNRFEEWTSMDGIKIENYDRVNMNGIWKTFLTLSHLLGFPRKMERETKVEGRKAEIHFNLLDRKIHLMQHCTGKCSKSYHLFATLPISCTSCGSIATASPTVWNIAFPQGKRSLEMNWRLLLYIQIKIH